VLELLHRGHELRALLLMLCLQLGGAEPDTEQLLTDAEAAASEGGEAIPRNSTVWAQLRYEVNASGSLVTVNRQPGTAAKPFDRDGARGIAALTAQVCATRVGMQNCMYYYLRYFCVT
jgi:hypothetical protein